MENKSSGKGLESFLAGKGFYIVLFLCAVIIGISAWSLASGGSVKKAEDADIRLEDGGAAAGDYDDSLPAEPAVNADDSTAPIEEPPETAETGTFRQGEVFDAAASVYASPLEGKIQRAYSADKLQYDETMADWRTHEGVDIACEKGAAVKAAHAGTVKSVYKDDLYGITVLVTQSDGLTCSYSNLTATPAVKAGDTVSAGTVIGYVGDTVICERAQEPHLHFAMSQNGKSVNPESISHKNFHVLYWQNMLTTGVLFGTIPLLV